MDGVDKEWVYTETGNRSAFYIKFLKDIILSRYALQMNTATGKTTSQNYVSIKAGLVRNMVGIQYLYNSHHSDPLIPSCSITCTG